MSANPLPQSAEYPTTCRFEITLRCMLACDGCFTSDLARGEELPLERITSLATALHGRGVTGVSLIGGEPLLRADVVDIVTTFAALDMNVRLVTSGIGGPRAGRRLAAAARHVDLVVLSIDEVAPIVGGFRDPRALRRNLDALATLAHAGVSVAVAAVVHPGNLGAMEDVAREVAARGATSVQFQFKIQTGSDGGPPLWPPDDVPEVSARFRDGIARASAWLPTRPSPPLLREGLQEQGLLERFLRKQLTGAEPLTCHFLDTLCLDPSGRQIVCPFIRPTSDDDTRRRRQSLATSSRLPVGCEGCCGLMKTGGKHE